MRGREGCVELDQMEDDVVSARGATRPAATWIGARRCRCGGTQNPFKKEWLDLALTVLELAMRSGIWAQPMDSWMIRGSLDLAT